MDKKRYVEKEKKSVLGIVISLVISIAVFIAVLIIQGAITDEEEKVTVIVANKNIEAPAFIDIKDADDFFKEMEVPKSLAYEGVIGSIDKLFGKEKEIYVVDALTEGEIVAEDCVIGGEDFLKGYKNPVEMGIKVSSFEDAAGGTIRRGDVVDMCILDEIGEEMKISVFVLQAFDSSGVRIDASDDASVAVAFTILIEREEYSEVAKIIELGKFDLVRTDNVK